MAAAASRSLRAAEALALDLRWPRHRGAAAALLRAVSRRDPDFGWLERRGRPLSRACVLEPRVRLAYHAFTPAGLGFLLVTIILSWVFIYTMFALHYPHEYYAEHGKGGGGVIFPHDPEPGYWGFVYLAFSIGTATQVSDVEISSKRIRRTVTVQGIVAFFFNVTVIALTAGWSAMPCRPRRADYSAAVRLRPAWPKRCSI